MGHITSKDAYKNLEERINWFTQGAPPTESLYRILNVLYTESEAKRVALLPVRPFTSETAAKIWKISEGQAEAFLEGLCQKALLVDSFLNGERQFVMPPPMAGFIEFALMRTRGDIDQKYLSELYIYHERWENELTYDEQKAHQDPRRITKPAHLRSETPAGVLQELYAASLAHFVIRSFMVLAAATVDADPDRMSFTGCFQILNCRLPECTATDETSLQAWLDAVLAEMLQERLPPRRNRINPRVIKRKISKWAKKRPEHRHPPPLTKTFSQSVVMLN